MHCRMRCSYQALQGVKNDVQGGGQESFPTWCGWDVGNQQHGPGARGQLGTSAAAVLCGGPSLTVWMCA